MSVNLIVDDVFAGEGDGFVDFVIRLDGVSEQAVTVDWSTSWYNTSQNGDFAVISGVVTIAAGKTSETVRVAIVNDDRLEGTEAFFFRLSNPINAGISRSEALATITDNDAAPGRPVVAVSDPVVNETDGVATFVITLDRPATGTVSMSYATQNGSAVAGQDFKAAGGTLKFAAGETSKVVTVSLIDDTAREGDQHFDLVLSNFVGATSLDPVGTAMIAANDQPAVPAPNLSVEDTYVDEGDGFAEFVVRLDAPSTETVTVEWETSWYNTSQVGDFHDRGGSLTFAAGETVKTVRVALSNDGIAEGKEAFFLHLSDPSNAYLSRPTGLATIMDNDAPVGPPVVAVSDLVVDEADGTATFVVTLDRPAIGTVSMSYATQNGYAVAGQDYTATGGTLRFAAGETSKVVKVSLIEDAMREISENFSLVLTDLVGATSLDPVGTALIVANDKPAVPAANLLVDDTCVGEGDGFAEFVVRLDAPATETVTVEWETGWDTTQQSSDFFDRAGSLTFAPGETVKTVRVALRNDDRAEGTETFYLKLSNPTNAYLARSEGFATILDDDNGTPPRQTIVGSEADDLLFGTGRNDKFDGGRGNDFISGGLGADYMSGGQGADTYLVDDLRDWVSEWAGGGTDTVQASVNATLSANVENLLLVGAAVINGTGNDLANRVTGNGATNFLDGKAGADALRGGAGADTFVFSTALGAGNVDRIADFALEDTIRLSKSVFSNLATGKLAASAFKEISAGKVDADDRILYNKATGTLSYDADGSGTGASAVAFATIETKAALTYQDFVIA